MKKNLYFHEEVESTVKTAPFYVLKRGEKFKWKGATYTKISDDNGRIGETKQFFWPQQTISLITPTKRSKLIEMYPQLGCNYWA